jgi:hypothetical protein
LAARRDATAGFVWGGIERMKYVPLICDDETVSPSNEELDAHPVRHAWLAGLLARTARTLVNRNNPKPRLEWADRAVVAALVRLLPKRTVVSIHAAVPILSSCSPLTGLRPRRTVWSSVNAAAVGNRKLSRPRRSVTRLQS